MNTCPTQKLKTWSAILTILLLVFLLLAPPHAEAATGINKQINFQGKVVNTNGTNVANGDYSFLFCLYTTASPATACTAAANNDAVWRESKTLTVTDGIFRTQLGDTTALPGSVDFNTDNIYLGTNFNSDGQMTPLVRFTAVPYAFNALKVAGLTVTDTTGTFTLAAAKTLTVNNTLTFAGTDATTLTFQGTDTYVGRATTDTLTNKTIGSTGLVFSGATTDITTVAGEALAITPNGAAALTLGTTGAGNTTSITLATDSTGDAEVVLPDNSIGTAEINDGADTPGDEECLTYELTGTVFEWQSCASGGGIATVRESDGTPSVASLSILEFGPATTSSDEFIVTDQTGGVARVVLGDKVVKTDATQTLSNKTFSSDINFLDANPGTAYTVAGSDSTTAAAAGGDITLRAGAGLTTGAGGNLIIAGGTSPSGTAGFLALQTAGTERFRVAADGTFLFEKGAQDVILSVTAPATSTRTYTIPDFGANDSFVGLAATQALTGKTYNGLTVNTTTGILALTNAKTLTVSDSTTLGTNAITLAGGEVITFSATNALSLLTTGSTSVTLPTSGTLVSSVTTGNGVSATNTAGALAFTLGAITPTTVNGLTFVAAATGFTAAGGTTSKTLTVSDSTTLATNAITMGGGEVITFSATNALSLLTTGTTSVTLPTAGTLLTNTAAAVQTVTSTQSTGTVFGVTDATALTGAIKGAVITLSGANAFDQTGLEFNLSNATGTNLNDIVGSGSTWKVSKAGAATFVSTTSPTHTGAGAVTVSSGGSSGLTFDSASGDITVAANDGLTFAATTLGNNGSRNVTINSGTGGTTATLIVKLDTSGTVVTTDTTTLNNAVGVALNTTTIGQAVRVAINGVVTATADNTVTAGDYIGLGTTTAGRAKSLGTTYPSTAGVQVIGRALGSQATPGSTFLLMLNGLDNNVAAGGGGGYNLIKDETTSLTARTTLAFLGTAVTCADNAGLTQTECTISGSGGGVSFASGTPDNTVTSNKLIHLQKSGLDKFVVANSGGLTITAGTSDTVKTTTGTTLATDFSITGSTLTNVTSANDLISINDGSVTNTMSTSTVVTAAAAGAGSHTILREDGQYIIIHGNSLATGSRWDGSSTTMTSVTVATGAVNPGAGSIALKRPDGRYLIVHGNASAGLTSLFDPRGVTAVAAGPAVCGAGAATTGTNAFLRQDGKYVILCGNLTAWGVYDPTANTYTVGTAVATAFGAGAHAIQRDDGTFLVFRGGGFTSHWIYNPFASATGTMTADPIVTTPPTISTGAFSIRRADGKFLVIPGAINTSYIYDPTRTSANSGAGTMTPQTVGVGFGPTVALGDGAQSLWRQDGKYLLIVGGATTTTNVIDPSKTDSTQFVAGPALNANAAAGIHAVMRPDGAYQIIRGGATTTTDIYNTGFIIGGAGAGTQLASYETECIIATSLNATSTLKWTGNSEGRMWFQVKTGTGSCSGSYKDIKNSGDLINPVAGDNRVQIKVFFQRDLPKFADQEWGIRRGLGQTRYRRTNKDPALYDVTVDNSTSFHRSQFEFGNSSDPSGPVMVNLTNNSDRNLAIALEMGVGYGSTINATNPQFYNGAFGTHPALATSATAGTVVMKRPDGKFMLVAGNTTTANAQLYDPVAQTFTAQAGAGNIPTAGTGLGALAIKRPNGTYLMLIGNATTTTNIYDPLGASGSQFVAGPALTAAAGRGAITIPLPNGRVLIMHGNFTNTSSIYDPIQNTMVAGPISSAVIGGGSMAIPRPNGTYFVVLGIATEACTALNTVTNNFDPYTMIFTATGSPAITTGVGPGAFTFQRSDGQWVIVHGGGTITTCAGTTRTQIYNPITNTSVVGPVLSGVAQHGTHAIQRPDGTWLVVHGGALTTTSIYLEKKGAFTAEGLAGIGQFIAGPALVTAASAGSISFQRDDGKFVTITGNAGLVVQQYDGGWISNGTYRSEAINIADLDSTSALVWQANADLTNISAEVRTATSKDNLQVATFREIPTSGGLINPSASEVWVNVNFNFKRTFPSYGGIYTDTWYNGGSPIQFAQRKIVIPTLNEFKITKDVDLINLKSDGLSVFRVNSDGDIYTSSYGSFNTGGADLAENYTSQVHLEKGEVVSIDPQNNHGVMRSKYQYQPDVLGVVSTQPGFVAGSFTKDSYPIALVGRVPVKVSTENGSIRAGDALTASSVSGHAMKTTKAGRVIGKALETIDAATLIECPPSDFQIPGRKCGTVMVFVNLIDYLGAPVEMVMEEKQQELNTTGLISSEMNDNVILGSEATPESIVGFWTSQNDTTTKQEQILAFLKQIKEEQASASAGYRSEIFTDRVTSQEIIGLNIFADTLHAKKIKADSIEGLEILTDKISSLQGQVAGLSTTTDATSSANVILGSEATPESSTDSGQARMTDNKVIEFGSGKFTLDLTVLGKLNASGGLIVLGPSEFKGESLFDKLATFISHVIFKDDVAFLGRPTFNKDTAGVAVIKKDADDVEVVFEKEYTATPIVSLSMTFDPVKLADGNTEDPKILQKRISEGSYSYFVTNRSTRGFTIVLNKSSSEDITFSWTALSVKDAKRFESKSEPTPTPSAVPALASPTPSSLPSTTPTTPIATSSATASPIPTSAGTP